MKDDVPATAAQGGANKLIPEELQPLARSMSFPREAEAAAAPAAICYEGGTRGVVRISHIQRLLCGVSVWRLLPLSFFDLPAPAEPLTTLCQNPPTRPSDGILRRDCRNRRLERGCLRSYDIRVSMG